jgi:hypothetical protein
MLFDGAPPEELRPTHKLFQEAAGWNDAHYARFVVDQARKRPPGNGDTTPRQWLENALALVTGHLAERPDDASADGLRTEIQARLRGDAP